MRQYTKHTGKHQTLHQTGHEVWHSEESMLCLKKSTCGTRCVHCAIGYPTEQGYSKWLRILKRSTMASWHIRTRRVRWLHQTYLVSTYIYVSFPVAIFGVGGYIYSHKRPFESYGSWESLLESSGSIPIALDTHLLKYHSMISACTLQSA